MNAPELSQEHSFQRPNKRPRVAVACLRCKTRRQKCDNQLPACSNCARASLTCVFAENEYPSSYVKALETRIALLESQLGSSQSSGQQLPPSTDNNQSSLTNSANETSSHAGVATPENGAPNLAKSVGMLSLQAAAEPQYFGVSSGVSLAMMIETAVYENARPYSNLSMPAETTESPFSNTSPTQTVIAPLPPHEAGASFIDAYLTYIQASFPFLSIKTLWKAHANRLDLEDAVTDDARYRSAMLQLVYAIGSRCLQLVGDSNATNVDPEGCYCSAIAKIQDELNVPNVQNIQILLLVAIYSLRSPSRSSVWHLCGLMIRQCIELGLHRQLRADNDSPNSVEFKKRLFWSIYHLERRIVLVLGRPLAINDEEVEIELPRGIEEDGVEGPMGHSQPIRERPTPSYSGLPARPVTESQHSISFHIHLLLLDQLNTKSRLTLCKLAKKGAGPKTELKIAKRFQELEDWKNSIFDAFPSADPAPEATELRLFTSRTPVQTPVSRPAMPESQRLALLLSYHRARRMLLQTILTDVRLSNQGFPFASFAKSSGEVCQINRRLHRLKSVPFTLLDLHSVFVAGFSMIYCAWIDPDLYDAEMAADFGACSTVLYLITEQWGASAKKYRDAFELVAEKTAEYVLSTRRTRERGQSRFVPSEQQTQPDSFIPLSNNVVVDEMHNQSNAYDAERVGNDGWANDSFDVWQMMTQFVQTQDFNLESDAVDFTGIEGFLAEEGLGWFNGGAAGGL